MEEQITKAIADLKNEVLAKVNEKADNLSEAQNEAIKALFDKQLNEKKAAGEITDADSIEALKDSMQSQFDELAMNMQEQASKGKSFAEQVQEQLEANLETLKSLKGDKSKEIKLQIKAPATQTTGNVTLPSATPAAYTYQGINAVIPQPELIPFVQNFTDNAPTEMVALPWVDEISSEGDADFIAEGVVKPLMDIDYEIRYSEAKKVAGKIKVSEESLTDIPFMANEINRKLRQRHDLAKQDGILNGDGTGANLLGITEYAAGFAAGSLANTVADASNYDVIAAAYNQIITVSDGNYIPGAVFVNPTDATAMRLTKDVDGQYVMPPFSAANGELVYGVRVVQNNKIPLGYFLMGDFSKSHVRDYVDFSIRIGYTGDDFEKNLVTMIGESRVHHYISENEKVAFVYDQFSVAKTALDPDLT